MAFRWVVGHGAYLDLVVQAWRQEYPNESVCRIDVPQFSDYSFDLRIFDSLNPEHGSMFVAFDERFGNFKRMELMQAAMERGFRLESFIHPSAAVDATSVIGPNVFIGPQTVIGHGCRIDYNVAIHAGVHVGPNSRIKASCWIENGVQLGAFVDIGSHCTIRMGALVGPGVKVGRNCELGWPQLYRENISSKTTFDPRYDQPILVYES